MGIFPIILRASPLPEGVVLRIASSLYCLFLHTLYWNLQPVALWVFVLPIFSTSWEIREAELSF